MFLFLLEIIVVLVLFFLEYKELLVVILELINFNVKLFFLLMFLYMLLMVLELDVSEGDVFDFACYKNVNFVCGTNSFQSDGAHTQKHTC